ncbi:hypothetical protein ACIQC8_10615 [Agrococcus sediminis]|uniref:hypothetical protein n=1 Tax=Agrococcus TaxID=46352 RepID=UPI001FF6D879|nr:hypothetical protein [Agrococcus sp. SCSIO52902]UOW01861.1 hypothetical protein MU522_05540 [Agrococcus sp. SCSIO52902]
MPCWCSPPREACFGAAACCGACQARPLEHWALAIPAMLPWFGICLAFLFGVTYLPVLFGWF